MKTGPGDFRHRWWLADHAACLRIQRRDERRRPILFCYKIHIFGVFLVTAQAKSQTHNNIVKIAKRKQKYGMDPFQLPDDEEIGAAYDESKEAVIALFHQNESVGWFSL